MGALTVDMTLMLLLDRGKVDRECLVKKLSIDMKQNCEEILKQKLNFFVQLGKFNLVY